MPVSTQSLRSCNLPNQGLRTDVAEIPDVIKYLGILARLFEAGHSLKFERSLDVVGSISFELQDCPVEKTKGRPMGLHKWHVARKIVFHVKGRIRLFWVEEDNCDFVRHINDQMWWLRLSKWKDTMSG